MPTTPWNTRQKNYHLTQGRSGRRTYAARQEGRYRVAEHREGAYIEGVEARKLLVKVQHQRVTFQLRASH